MKKIIPTIILLIIIGNTMFSSEAFDYFLKVKDKEIEPDTLISISEYDTCVVADTLTFDKLYYGIKNYILKKDSTDWTKSTELYLKFYQKSSTEYNITINVGYSDVTVGPGTLCRYKDKLFMLDNDIPPYFKDTGKVSITNKFIIPGTVYRDRFYHVKFKNGVFYNCDGYKFNIIEDDN